HEEIDSSWLHRQSRSRLLQHVIGVREKLVQPRLLRRVQQRCYLRVSLISGALDPERIDGRTCVVGAVARPDQLRDHDPASGAVANIPSSTSTPNCRAFSWSSSNWRPPSRAIGTTCGVSFM